MRDIQVISVIIEKLWRCRKSRRYLYLYGFTAAREISCYMFLITYISYGICFEASWAIKNSKKNAKNKPREIQNASSIDSDSHF